MNKTAVLLPIAFLATCAGRAAMASGNYTWNFSTAPGDQGISHNYSDTSSTYTLTALGFDCANAPESSTIGSTWSTGATSHDDLWGKNNDAGDGQYGLGLVGDSSHRIMTTQFAQVDLTACKSALLSNLTITCSDIAHGEGCYIYGSNQSGTPGVLLASYTYTGTGTTSHIFSLPQFPEYSYFSVCASPGHTIIGNGMGLSASTPEPGSLALLGAMFIPVGRLMIRRRGRKAARS